MILRPNLKSVFLFLFLIFPSLGQTQENIKEADQLDFAQGLLSRGMYDMAILQYQKFISDNPKSTSLQDAYLALGEGYFLSQDFDKAFKAFNQFKDLYPHSDQLPVSLLRLAQMDIQQKKYDEALKELTSIDAQKQLKGPMLQSFDFYQGEAYIGKADATNALDFFQKASQVDGATSYTGYALKEIGKIQSVNSHYPQALDAYSKSLSLATENDLKGELTYRIAEVQFLSGKYDEAIKGFDQVINQYPTLGYTQDAISNKLLGFFNLGQYDQLIVEYQKNSNLIKDDDTSFEIQYVVVEANIELKKYDAANLLLDHLLTFKDLKPQDKERIFVKKADILIRNKNFKDALAMLESNTTANSGDADEVFFLKAQSNFGLGNYDKAFSCYENIYLNYPNSRFYKAALLGQAHTRQETGRNKESKDLFLKYYQVQDQADLKSESLYDAVMMAVKASDAGEIIRGAEDYLKTFPTGENYSEVLLILADTYGNNNRPQDAIHLLQGYLKNPLSSQRPNSANFLLGYYMQFSGDAAQALSAYTQVDPKKEDGKFYAAALKNMAIIYLNQKKEDQAKLLFDQLISQALPNDLQVKTYIWVCNEYMKEEKYSDVLRIAAQAEKNFKPQDLLEIEYFKAEALRGLGTCDEALKNYTIVLASPDKDSFTGSAHLGSGLCLAKEQKYPEAKAEFQKALDENADDYTITVHARFELANLEAAQGHFEDAIKFYLLVATIYDDDHYCSEALLQAGKISEQLKKPQDASKFYSEILAKYKNSKAAEYAKERIPLLK